MAVNWELIHFFWKYSARTLCILICVWAFFHGGVAERTGAFVTIVAWYLSFLFATHDGSGPPIATVLVDVVAMLSFIALAVGSRRPWTFFIAACMVNTVATHVIARTLEPSLFASITVSGLWGGYGILICLAAGIMGYWKRLRRERDGGLGYR